MSAFTESERQEMLSSLLSSRDLFLSALAGVSEEQGAIRISPDCWTIRDCVEHVASAERLMLRSIEKAPATGAYANPARDQATRQGMLDRTRKRIAPEMVKPSGRFCSLGEAIESFCQHRQRTIAFVEQTQEDLRQRCIDHPLLGPIDGYQLLLAMVLHPQRHAAQIEEIKASSTFRSLAAAAS
ncbi:MAG TPA: DinB family protein [Terriglobales bacterium]|nr:DinB family protein [Terriglobales bacterium]